MDGRIILVVGAGWVLSLATANDIIQIIGGLMFIIVTGYHLWELIRKRRERGSLPHHRKL